MSSTLSVPEQIRQLNDARKLVLGDVKYYPSVVRGILPIIGPSAPIELRRWGTDFLAEAFATPALPNSEKETMQPYVLTTLESLAESEVDAQVLRSVIQTAASIYPVALRWIINNGYDTLTWERMVSIKQRILRIWDNAPSTVGICCIKFAQRVILAQSVSTGNEQRYGGGLDVSLDKIPPNHQTLDPRTLEAEANGLLDRMLHVLSGSSDAISVDATLNCMSILVRTRPATSSRILNALLAFNPLQAATSPLSPKNKVMIRSMEKTSRLLLLHLSKRDPHHPLVPRIQQHVDSTMRMVAELFDTRKRPLEPPSHEPWGDAKRQRVDAKQIQIPPLGSGPHSLADVFTLVGSSELRGFDVSQVPTGLVARIAVNTLSRLDPQILARAVDGVRGRLETLDAEPAPELNPNTAPLGVEEDEDDYEPDLYQAAEDTEQILNQLDNAPAPAPMAPEPLRTISLDDTLGLKAFSLPQPSQLTPETALSAGAGTVTRVLEMMKSLEEPAAKKHKVGFNRLAASSESRDSWMTILARLATRSSAGLEAEDEAEEGKSSVKKEDEDEDEDEDEMEEGEASEVADSRSPSDSSSLSTPTLSQSIREMLYNYVMEDFRKHIDVAVSWLCEEWYNDRMQQRRPRLRSRLRSRFGSRSVSESGLDGQEEGHGDEQHGHDRDQDGDRDDNDFPRPPLHYERCALRLIDGFLPYLHPQDKVLTRFLSEIPELNQPILSRVKHMCRDPSVVPLALTSLLYLVIMRPPVKEAALDTVQDIWTEFEDARSMAAKYLAKYRPAFLETAAAENCAGDGDTPLPATAAIAT